MKLIRLMKTDSQARRLARIQARRRALEELFERRVLRGALGTLGSLGEELRRLEDARRAEELALAMYAKGVL